MTPTERYPALLAYIHDRTPMGFDQMWDDEREAEANGAFSGVVADLQRAQADYKAEQEALGRNGYPYNAAMGIFLGLPLRENHEPPRGYYFARCVASHYKLGIARREVERLVAIGATLAVVTARSKATGKPVRLARFAGDQIKVLGSTVEASDGRRKIRLTSNWSTETCLEKVALAMSTGAPFGA